MANTNFSLRVNCLTFNHSKYIEDCLNGFCIQQTDFQFICTIIDDASTDGEQDVINNYLDEHFDMDGLALLPDLYVGETDYEAMEQRNKHLAEHTAPWRCDAAEGIYTFVQHKTNKNCYVLSLNLKKNLYGIADSKVKLIAPWDNAKYIALCEGDDYWTDPLKLQKQVDVMRKCANVGICFGRTKLYYQETGEYREIYDSNSYVGLMRRDEFSKWNCLGRYLHARSDLSIGVIHTSSTLVRRSAAYEVGVSKYGDIAKWRIRFGDTLLFQLAAVNADVFFLPDVVSIYRRQPNSLTHVNSTGVMRDAYCVFAPYFLIKQFNCSAVDATHFLRKQIFEVWCQYIRDSGRKNIRYILMSWCLLKIFLAPRHIFDFVILMLGIKNSLLGRISRRYRNLIDSLYGS